MRAVFFLCLLFISSYASTRRVIRGIKRARSVQTPHETRIFPRPTRSIPPFRPGVKEERLPIAEGVVGGLVVAQLIGAIMVLRTLFA